MSHYEVISQIQTVRLINCNAHSIGIAYWLNRSNEPLAVSILNIRLVSFLAMFY